MTVALQALAFFIIAANFIFLVLAVIEPWLSEIFRKPPRHEAVIIPFTRPTRRGGRHV
ncbi:hypothetical protein [Rhizobium rhizogenes]|uniref:hypothetical protein n=1 Tax=Rhizobium rhizogenes TaxID=359 RepID=UPI0015720F74|nr:hypothetical protein [Rhizobium rhizogenes]NTG07211.1 hypothetical protein [Rhizobium rhizogenes]